MSNTFKSCSSNFKFETGDLNIEFNEDDQFVLDGQLICHIEEFELFVERSRRLLKFHEQESAWSDDE